MASEAATHGAEHAGEFDMAEMLTHHMVNSQELELPWGVVHLPTLDIFGYELPITRHAVMMWVASLLVMVPLIWIARRARRVPPGRQTPCPLTLTTVKNLLAALPQ